MSLYFPATTARIDHGSATVLDSLATFTLWAWVVRTVNGANQHVITKDNGFPSGPLFVVDTTPGEGALRLLRGCTTSNSDYGSVAGVVPLNVPTFVAATYDIALATQANLYTGTLVRPVTEVAYNTAIAGVGTLISDAAHNLQVGNVQRSNLNFKGRIGWYGVINRRLTQGELEQIRTAPTIHNARVSGTVLLSGWQNTTATQIDLSGYGNHGTVTGATVHEPLPFRLWNVPIVGKRASGAVTTARARFLPLQGVA